VLQGAGISIAVRTFGLALSYAANILLSRSLGVQGFGQYSIALSWVIVLTLPAKAGFDNSALRYCTIYLERADFSALRGFLRFATLTVVAITALLDCVILAAGSHLIPVPSAIRIWMVLLLPPLALTTLYSVVVRTAQQIAAAQFYEQVMRPFLVVAGLSAALVVGVRITLPVAMGLTTIAAMVAFATLVGKLLRTLRKARLHRPLYSDWHQWIAVSVPMLVLGLMQELMNQIDIILLGRLADARQAALFAASSRLASVVPFALVAFGTISGPLIAAAHDRGSVEELHRVSRLVARAGSAFALLAAITLFELARPLLALFGPDFIAGRDVLIVLLLGGIANALTGVVAYFMTLTGRERPALVIFAGGLVLSIGLNVLLIPRFGALGSAIASSSALAGWNIAMVIYVRWTIGIDASALSLIPQHLARPQ
jgi:O-antigen/teichoic acid export membrane protein